MTSVDNIKFKTDARNALFEGASIVGEAVVSTLGPKGKLVLIDNGFGLPNITKDGVSVAKSIELKDRLLNMGAEVLKEVSTQTNTKAGDGTTTSTAIALELIKQGKTHLTGNINPVDFKKGIDMGKEIAIDYIIENSMPCKTDEDIMNVAKISTNGDEDIAALIKKAMDEVGQDGVITVDVSNEFEDSLEIEKGLRFNNGYASQSFINNRDNATVDFENAMMILIDDKVTSIRSLIPIFEDCIQNNQACVIIANDFVPKVIDTLVINAARTALQVCAIKAPGVGSYRSDILSDIAALTNSTVISETTTKLKDITTEHCGFCEKINVSRLDTTITATPKNEQDLETHITEIYGSMSSASTQRDVELLQERIARLKDGIAVIKIGAHSETELKERKDRADDALCATKSAIEEGIVPGGCVTLIKAANKIHDFVGEFSEEELGTAYAKGLSSFAYALEYPFNAMLTNAGIEPFYFGDYIEQIIISKGNNGYDLNNMDFVDMIESGIIDPTKVTRCAVENAASVVGTLLMTDTVVIPLSTQD